MLQHWRTQACLTLGVTTLVGLVWTGSHLHAQAPPAPITDDEFRRLLTELSEPGGTFARQVMSNEDSLLAVVQSLRETVQPDGVYIGVGSEQNFTYLAALRPRIAFIVDIRRENQVQMLLYKALFELAPDRAAFVSRLFSRRWPVEAAPSVTVEALFERLAGIAPDAAWTDEIRDAVIGTLGARGISLEAADRAAVASVLETFRTAGPQGLKGFGDRTNPTFAELMAATDFNGRQQGFLATEAAYQAVRAMQRENRIMPIVGDFAGDHALAAIGAYLRERSLAVDVFYVSNVERYLWEQGPRGRRFYDTVARLPRRPGSVFVRSVTRDISTRLGIELPDLPTKWWTFVALIDACLDGVASGRIASYAGVFTR